MTEEVQTPPPIQITDSTVKEQGGAAMRDVLLILSALPALMAVLGTRDVVKIVAYLNSVEFAPVLAAAVLIGTVIWRQMLTRWNKRKLITTGEAAPNSVSVVVAK